MSKKDFIALADCIKAYNELAKGTFSQSQIVELANFCATQNPRFNRERWLGYIAGTNGPNGGKK